MSRSLIFAVVAASVVLGAPLAAHHRFAETYLEDREVTIEGDVARWEYREPHSFMYVTVTNPSARTQPDRWIVECRGAGQLQKQGLTPDTVKPGQHVIVTGSPGRVAADHRLRLRTIVRPQDGWRWRAAVD